MLYHFSLDALKIRPTPRGRSNGKTVHNESWYKAYKDYLIGLYAIHLDESVQNLDKLSLCVLFKNVKKGDLDNIKKAVGDSLKQAGIIKEDNITVLGNSVQLSWLDAPVQGMEVWIVTGEDQLPELSKIILVVDQMIKTVII